ncbi:hypothetical protein [Stakelama tenebrarum]|uniref:Entericidin EcnAB n=1 Tax=Stakelama tenebrarum TaxID=2711215 RepID=A0A6G6Y512_9SPHN|nr:hypothetical protein [Sphingosinithalassobacter tenebrarum]QIG80005.1 hypothetical protein G5C33_09595 [Sphingosinithalassobacter tenebrarum]
MKRTMLLPIAAAVSMTGLAACSENAQEQTEQAADAVGQDIETTTEGAAGEAGEAFDDAGAAIDEGVDETGAAIDNGMNEAGSELQEEAND